MKKLKLIGFLLVSLLPSLAYSLPDEEKTENVAKIFNEMKRCKDFKDSLTEMKVFKTYKIGFEKTPSKKEYTNEDLDICMNYVKKGFFNLKEEIEKRGNEAGFFFGKFYYLGESFDLDYSQISPHHL